MADQERTRVNKNLQQSIISVLARTVEARAMSDIRWHLPGWEPGQIDQGLRALVIMGVVGRGERPDGTPVYWLAIRPEAEHYRGPDFERWLEIVQAVAVGIAVGALAVLVLIGFWRAP